VIHAEAVMGKTIAVEVRILNGFLIVSSRIHASRMDAVSQTRDKEILVKLDLARGLNIIGSSE